MNTENTNITFIKREECKIERSSRGIRILYAHIIFNVEFEKAEQIMHKYFEHFKVINCDKKLIVESEIDI